MNKKVIKVEQIFQLIDALADLYTQNLKYKINVAYKLNKIFNELKDLEKYTLDRLAMLIPQISDVQYKLSDDEMEIYNAILLSDIEIDTFGLTEEELFCLNNDENTPTVELKSIEILKLLV